MSTLVLVVGADTLALAAADDPAVMVGMDVSESIMGVVACGENLSSILESLDGRVQLVCKLSTYSLEFTSRVENRLSCICVQMIKLL